MNASNAQNVSTNRTGSENSSHRLIKKGRTNSSADIIVDLLSSSFVKAACDGSAHYHYENEQNSRVRNDQLPPMKIHRAYRFDTEEISHEEPRDAPNRTSCCRVQQKPCDIHSCDACRRGDY